MIIVLLGRLSESVERLTGSDNLDRYFIKCPVMAQVELACFSTSSQ
jgi:hypothetical protein